MLVPPLLALLPSCGDGGARPEGERTHAAPNPGARPSPFRFADVTEASGLAAFRQSNGSAEKTSILESVGGGVAFLDADGDGRLDLWLSNGGPAPGAPEDERPADALFRNVDGTRFEDATESFGLAVTSWTCGVRTVDLDGDGWTDVYLTAYGPNTLFANRGGERFEDVTARAGVGEARWSTGAAFLDHDRDGDLDLYVANYVELDAENPPPPARQYEGLTVFVGPRGLPGARDTFYRNRGDGTFEDATEAAGVSDSTGYAFQAVAFDADDDGWLDVYVANDSTPNRLWRGRGDGTFEDVAARVGLSHGKSGKAQAGMGVAVGDADGDGRFDVFVTNFSEDYNTLYRNLGGGLYADATMRSGIGMASWDRLGWACGFVDWDGDADLDLFCVNGHVFPQVDGFESGTRYRQANQLFENDGAGRFAETTDPAGAGFGGLAAGRGAAWGDYDGDGDPDLCIGNIDGPPTLLRNDAGAPGRWLGIELVATRGHPSAIGAVVAVETELGARRHPYGEGSGFLSSSAPGLRVGLGPTSRPVAVRVDWPGRGSETFDVEVGSGGRAARLVEGQGEGEGEGEGTPGAERRPAPVDPGDS